MDVNFNCSSSCPPHSYYRPARCGGTRARRSRPPPDTRRPNGLPPPTRLHALAPGALLPALGLAYSGQHHEAKWCQMLLVCFRPQIAERGTQDFSTRLIKHTELGKRVLRAGIKALAITKTFPNIRVTHHTPAQPLVTMGPKYLWILVWIFSFHYMYSRDC